jgi:phosphohistidine phosphatase
MKLLVIRHAKAEERDAARWPDDSLRPLSANGVEQFRKSAAGLAKLITPGALLTSSFLRARQTAAILHEVAQWPEPEETASLAGSASVAALVKQRLMQSPEATVAIIGHEPTLSALISSIVAGHPRSSIEMKPGVAALLDLTGGPEAALAGKLVWLAQPKLTRLMV